MDNVDLSGAKVLLVDDNPTNLTVLWRALEGEAYEVMVATSGPQALQLVRSERPDLILLDVMMPNMDGFETCRRLQEDDATRDIPVIFITARDDTEALVEGLRVGGRDFVVKPFRTDEVLARTRTHLERARLAQTLADRNRELEEKNAQLQREIDRRRRLTTERDRLVDRVTLLSEREDERWGAGRLLGDSPVMRDILDQITRLQQSGGTISVLITGESGTGKELIARGIHAGSGRAGGPFVPVNCSAVPAELAESLFFGHCRGAFTGADRDRAGYFELADGGTLFLDEVGDMPLELQAKLLRALDDGVITPVGAQDRTVDVRILAATNADLQQRITGGTFRQDLYFRLARYSVEAPPLRQRRQDIAVLTEHFLNICAREMGRATPALSPAALQALEAYPFPGNVRELRNIVERALIESGGGEIRPGHLHLLAVEATIGEATQTTLVENEKRHIQRALELAGWVIEGDNGAAQRLDINPGTLRSRMRKLGIERPR